MTTLAPRSRSIACAFAAYGLLACNDAGTSSRDYGPVLAYLSDDVIVPEHRDFASKANALVDALRALKSDPSERKLERAEDAWRDARRAYRVLDAVRIGPDLTSHVADRIDVAPADPAGIEAIVEGSGAVDDGAVAAAGGKKKGFLGLEYLLFADPNDAASVAPVLLEDDAAARRRSLAVSMGDELEGSAHELADAWEPGGGDFGRRLADAGEGSESYSTQRAAINDLVGGGASGALELIVGVRLALPLGRKTGGTPDPSLDPTGRSDSAVADMQATLDGVSAVYDGKGFASVVNRDSAELDRTMTELFADSVAALGAIPSPFAEAVLASHGNKVQTAYTATQKLKQTWNTSLSSALGATVKVSDTDGD